jgi:two-component system chemotaxis sensor kinase CheA
MNEFLEQFLIESRELIAQATDDLLVLEQEPGDAARLDSAFRAFHTLKGGAGIVDFDAMALATHAVEDVLSELRAGTRKMSPQLINHCLACLDQITLWLVEMEASEAVPETADAEAARMIELLTPTLLAPAALPPMVESGEAALPAYAADILCEQIALMALPRDEGTAGRMNSAMRVMRNIFRHYGMDAGERAATPALETPRDEAAAQAARPQRIDMARIDALVKLAGELVVVKNTLGHEVQLNQEGGDSKTQAASFTKLHARLDRLTSDLLRSVLAARVLPLRQVFQRFPRLVREMAASLDKPVRLVTEGDATEADRLIVEALFEPVLHVLRNAVDHGIEPASQRAATGKPNPAIIRLAAAREGDEVVIEIADDGRGIDPAVIRATAQARGLASAEALAGMKETEILEMIFAPGFSTAGAITSLSGRGVGMDAVRAAIAGLGGRVELQSTLGQGTTIRFHLPYSVMLTRVLTVEAGGQAFGVPFEAVVETVQIRRHDIAALGAARAILWRGRNLPLIGLAGTLDLPDAGLAEMVLAVIVERGGEWGAIQVDRFGGQLELMLKPLDGLLAGMSGIAGTALLGDGRVLIVLELHELLT